jgi:hypothetical protein
LVGSFSSGRIHPCSSLLSVSPCGETTIIQSIQIQHEWSMAFSPLR